MRSTLLVPLAVVALASGLRLSNLTAPPRTYWDEGYYAFDAMAYLGGWVGLGHPDDPPAKIPGEDTWVHPPLGKWMIAFGVGPLGARPIGWRLPPAVFGVAGVLLLYLLAYRLWRSVWWAGLAGMLLALDGLHVVHSRIAMLDVFATTFLTAGFLFLVMDRGAARDVRVTTSARWFGTPYRFWAGLMLGAAVATKWSAVPALVLAGALFASWRVSERRRIRTGAAAATDSPGDGLRTGLVCFLAVPVAVYLASYLSFFLHYGAALADFLALQKAMLLHQLHHTGVQAENSAPLTWPLMLHPIRYYPSAATVPAASDPRIVAIGNPILWYGFLGLLPLLVARAFRRPAWRERLVLGGYAAGYLPWLVFSRTQFIYYMLPAVPFMALGTTAALRSLRRPVSRLAGVAFAALAGVGAVLLLPAWTYLSVPAGWFHALDRVPGWP